MAKKGRHESQCTPRTPPSVRASMASKQIWDFVTRHSGLSVRDGDGRGKRFDAASGSIQRSTTPAEDWHIPVSPKLRLEPSTFSSLGEEGKTSTDIISMLHRKFETKRLGSQVWRRRRTRGLSALARVWHLCALCQIQLLSACP